MNYNACQLTVAYLGTLGSQNDFDRVILLIIISNKCVEYSTHFLYPLLFCLIMAVFSYKCIFNRKTTFLRTFGVIKQEMFVIIEMLCICTYIRGAAVGDVSCLLSQVGGYSPHLHVWNLHSNHEVSQRTFVFHQFTLASIHCFSSIRLSFVLYETPWQGALNTKKPLILTCLAYKAKMPEGYRTQTSECGMLTHERKKC